MTEFEAKGENMDHFSFNQARLRLILIIDIPN